MFVKIVNIYYHLNKLDLGALNKDGSAVTQIQEKHCIPLTQVCTLLAADNNKKLICETLSLRYPKSLLHTVSKPLTRASFTQPSQVLDHFKVFARLLQGILACISLVRFWLRAETKSRDQKNGRRNPV